MPVHTYCMNCHMQKDPRNYADYLCPGCETAKSEAREYALHEGLDAGSVIKQALAARIANPMSEKDPRAPFDRIDSSAMKKRMEIESGSITDPTRTNPRG